MNDTTNTYNLSLYGSDLKGQELQEAIAKLAKMLNGTPEQAKQRLDEKGSIIGKELPRDFAEKTKQQLSEIGIYSNIVLAKSSRNLELAPIEKRISTLICPVCQHKHTYQEDEIEPDTCVKCGLVFERHKKTLEKIRQASEREQRLVEERNKQMEEARKLKEREKEIRRELGLPIAINSQTRLLLSAVALHVLGILLGISSVSTYYSFVNRGAKTLLEHNIERHAFYGIELAPLKRLDPKKIKISPGTLAQVTVSRIFDVPVDDANPRQSFVGDANSSAAASTDLASETSSSSASVTSPNAVAESSIATSAKKSTTPSIFLETKLANFEVDAEWDYFLLTRTNALLAQGKAANAAKLVTKVGGAVRRFDRGARLLGQLWNRNQIAAANGLYRTLTAAGERLTGGPAARIAALCTIARYLNAFGRRPETEALLQKVRMMADTIIKPEDKAMADGEIAALLTTMGRTEDARFMFSSAIEILGTIPHPIQQLSTVAQLALGYAKAGYRASALHLLEDAIRKGGSLPKDKASFQALGELAEVSAQLMDIQMALNAMQMISDITIRDQIIYRVLTQEILSDRLAQAIDLATRLKTPTYKALAYGFLGLRQRDQVAYQGLAATSAAQASKAANAIENTAEKSAVMGELGRFADRSGDAKKARQYFAESQQLAEKLVTQNRDRALAMLAANQAQALHFTKARQILTQVTDVNIRYLVTVNTDNWQQAVNSGL